jgi:hypothetical protein
MSEEAPKLDQLKLIPQVFFDPIARVVPGAVGIVAAVLLSKKTLESWFRDALGDKLFDSPVGVLAIFLMVAYVVGQVISPLAKGVQRVGEWVCSVCSKRKRKPKVMIGFACTTRRRGISVPR